MASGASVGKTFRFPGRRKGRAPLPEAPAGKGTEGYIEVARWPTLGPRGRGTPGDPCRPPLPSRKAGYFPCAPHLPSRRGTASSCRSLYQEAGGVKPRSGPLSRSKVRIEQVGYWVYPPASNRQLSIRYSTKKLCSLASACCDLRGFVQLGFDIGAYGYLVDGFCANSRKILLLMQQKDAVAG